MIEELERLRNVLRRTIHNKNTVQKNRELAKEALHGGLDTIKQLKSDDPRDQEEASARLKRVFRPSSVTTTAQKEVEK